MSKRQKIIILSSLLWLFFLSPVFFLYWKEAHWIASRPLVLSWNLEEPLIKISKAGSPICQYFVAPEDNLARIDLMLSRGEGSYLFELFDAAKPSALSIAEPGTWELRRTIDFKNEAQNYDFMSFFFEPIADSEGEAFLFCLSSDVDEQLASGVFLAVEEYEGHGLSYGAEVYRGVDYYQGNDFNQGAHVYQEADAYQEVDYYEGVHFYQGKNLVYQVYSYNKTVNFWNFFDRLFTRMSQYKPEIFKIPYLYALWAGFYAALWFVIYRLITLAEKK